MIAVSCNPGRRAVAVLITLSGLVSAEVLYIGNPVVLSGGYTIQVGVGLNPQLMYLNNVGQIAGTATTVNGELRAFLLSGGVTRDLGILPNTPTQCGSVKANSQAKALNDKGWVAGSATYRCSSGGMDNHAFLYQGGYLRDLGSILADSSSRALGLNNGGLVVGSTVVTPSTYWQDSVAHGFLYQANQMRDLGVPPGYQPTSNAGAAAINNGGDIAGVVIKQINNNGWIIGIAQLTFQRGDTAQDAGTMYTNRDVYPVAMNDQGVVVGYGVNLSNSRRPFRWDGGFQDLGTLAAYPNYKSCQALDINNKGEIVGACYSESNSGVSRGFLYKNGQMLDLTALVDTTALNDSIAAAYSINDLGQILAMGFKKAWLLNPMGLDTSVPVTLYADPNTGAVSQQTFSAEFAHPYGHTNLEWVQMLFAAAPDGGGQSFCFVHYDVAGNGLWLYSDIYGWFVGPITPGTPSNVLQGHLCAINTQESSVVKDGNFLTVKPRLVFKGSGERKIYLRTRARNGKDTGWVQHGQVTLNAIPGPTGFASSPNSGSGTTPTFQLSFPEPPGFAGFPFGWMQFLVAAATNGGGQPFCFVHYDRAGNGLWMYSGDVGFFIGPAAPGSISSLNSSACSVTSAALPGSADPAIFRLNTTLNLKTPMRGTKRLYMRSLDALRREAPWTDVGSWTRP